LRSRATLKQGIAEDKNIFCEIPSLGAFIAGYV